MPGPEAGSESDQKQTEDRKLRWLRRLVQMAQQMLCQSDTTLQEAVRTVEGVKRYALDLFPGKERAWDIIYAPRFERILEERWGYVRNNEKPGTDRQTGAVE